MENYNNKVYKTIIHANRFIAKFVEIKASYAKVITQYGKVDGFIIFTRKDHWASTNVNFNDKVIISFSAA